MYPTAEKRFITINKITLFVLFMVITAGGIVRSTGSGMGCPDWPKCFNQIIPPTDVSQLPAGYEKHYVAGREKKNQRFAKMVAFFGFPEKAEQIRTDKSILVHEAFNVAKTWTEYLNRLVGVLAGFCLLAAAIYSFTYIRTKKSIFVWSVLNVFVVVVQAWLGSVVVSTNLMPWVITVHLLLALFIVAIGIYTYFKATSLRAATALGRPQSTKGLRFLAIFSLLVMLVQVVYGTEVREHIDYLQDTHVQRTAWISAMGESFNIHRLLGYLTLTLVLVLFFWIKTKFDKPSKSSTYAGIALILVVMQLISGIVLAKYHVPAFAQTAHLVVASLLFAAQYYLVLLLSEAKKV